MSTKTSGPQNIFTRINTRKLKERAFTKLLESRNAATVKVKGGNSYQVDVYERSGKQFSGEIFGADATFVESGVVNIVFSFNIGPEKFFMQTTAEIEDSKNIKISGLSELFKLQRRQNFRVEIPGTYSPSIYIETLEETQIKHNYSVLDLSLGGLAFEIPMDSPLAIEQGNILHGQFHMEDFPLKFSFRSEVRYITYVGSRGSGVRKVGIEFSPLETELENNMLEILIQIQKETIGMLTTE